MQDQLRLKNRSRINLEMHGAIVALEVWQYIYDNIIIATEAEISGTFASASAVVQHFPAAHASFFAAEEVGATDEVGVAGMVTAGLLSPQ